MKRHFDQFYRVWIEENHSKEFPMTSPFTRFETEDGIHYGIAGVVKKEIGDVLVVEFDDIELRDLYVTNGLFNVEDTGFPLQQFEGLPFIYEIETGHCYIRPRNQEWVDEINRHLKEAIEDSRKNPGCTVFSDESITFVGGTVYELKKP